MPSHSQEKNSLGNSVADAKRSSCLIHGAGCRCGAVKHLDDPPASRPLSLPSSPKRPRVPSRGAVSSNKVSSAGKNARLSSAAGKDGARAGAEFPVRGGGNATMPTSVDSLHDTQRGFKVPLIRGIPPHGGLQPETSIEYAKVKSRRAPHQRWMAARGAFSNVTTLAILQRARSLQLNSRQVEPVGWVPIEPSPMGAGAFDDDDAEEEFMAQMQRRAAGMGRKGSPLGTTPGGARGSAVHSRSASSRAFSNASLISSDTVMAAEPWKEDAAAPSAAQAMLHGTRKTSTARAQAVAPLTSPPTRPCNGGSPEGDDDEQLRQHRHTVAPIASAPYGSSIEYVARCATHIAASTERPRTRSLTPRKSQLPTSADHLDGATACSSCKSSASMPRGLERFIERGKRRRAEAERARVARAAEVAGELLIAAAEPNRSKDDGAIDASSTDDGATGQPCKVPMMPLPRTGEAHAQAGQSRRVEGNGQEKGCGTDGMVNYTPHPRVNRPSIVSASASGGAGAQTPELHQTPRSSAAAAEDGAAAAERPSLSVFERLATKGEQRDYRLRQREERYTSSLQSPISGLATAAAAAQWHHRGSVRGASSAAPRHTAAQQAEDPGAQTCTDAPTPTAAPASPRSLMPKAHRRGAASPGRPATAPNKSEAGATTAGDASAVATVRKKSQAEVEQHLARMRSREAEGRTRWERHPAARASERVEVQHGRVVVRQKAVELAKQQRADDEAQRAVTAHKTRQRTTNRRCTRPSPHHVTRSEPAADVPWRGAKLTPAAVQHTRPAADDFYVHQLKVEGRRQRYLERLRLQRAEEELSECTFRPRLNGTSERMAQSLVVESFHEGHAGSLHSRSALTAAPSEEVVFDDHSAGSLPQLAAYDGAYGLSPLVRSGEGSPFRELSRASPRVHGYVSSPSVSRSRLVESGIGCGTGTAFTGDCSYGSIKSLNYDGCAVEAMALPDSSSGPLAEQLRSLQEMLDEWKAIERACSPMLKQFSKRSVVE